MSNKNKVPKFRPEEPKEYSKGKSKEYKDYSEQRKLKREPT